MSKRTLLMCVGAPAAAPVRAIDSGLSSTGHFGSQRRGHEGNRRPQLALWPPALISIPIRKGQKAHDSSVYKMDPPSCLCTRLDWLEWWTDFWRRRHSWGGVTLLRSRSLRRLLSVQLRMKEKTTPAARFRHILGSQSAALLLRGQKPDTFHNTLSLKWGTFSLAEARSISSRFQMLSVSCTSRSVDYPAEVAAGYFSFCCTSFFF